MTDAPIKKPANSYGALIPSSISKKAPQINQWRAMLRQMRSTLLVTVLALHVSAMYYGVDCSFPQHRQEFNCGELLGDRKSVYIDYMTGCRQYYGADCDEFETDRLRKNQRKPQSMVNYTSTGFMKARAPKNVMNLLNQYWREYKNSAQEEAWRTGDTRANHWVTPTYLVDLYKDGYTLVDDLYSLLKPEVEHWTGMEQRPASLYGIRVYGRGAILAPHVDRYPLISSVIINIDQDVDEPWPLE